MSKNRCILIPEVHGEGSQLYEDLLNMTGSKPVTNYIYAAYLQLGVATLLDNAGKERDKLGLHSAKDVYKFFNVDTMQIEASNIYNAKVQSGATNSIGKIIEYSDAIDALNKVISYNSNHIGTIASAMPVGDHFEIAVDTKDSRTQLKASEMEETKRLWDTLDSFFLQSGLDLKNLDFASNMVNPFKVQPFVDMLKNSLKTDPKYFGKLQIQIFLTMSKALSSVDRLQLKFGTLDDVAQKIWDVYRGNSTVTELEKILIDNAMQQSLKYNGLDLSSLEKELAAVSQDFKTNSVEEQIHTTLTNLNKKYGVNNRELNLISDHVGSLSEAAAKASIILKRHLRELEKNGELKGAKVVQKQLLTLLRELDNNNFYRGMTGYLQHATTLIKIIDAILTNIDRGKTTMEAAKNEARAIMEIKEIIDSNKSLLRSLSNIDTLISDEKINDVDKLSIQLIAQQLSSIISAKEGVMKDFRKSTMITIATEILGNSLPNGVSIANIVAMQETDSSIFDNLYSIGRISDPLVAAMGLIIRDAQDTRDKKMAEISLRIRRATHALYKSGSNSEFMYDSDGRIISDIDWEAYYKARSKAIKNLLKQGLIGYDLKEAIKQWLKANTEERIVNYMDGRTERVPDVNFRIAFPLLTLEQREYYDTMMQLKGEIGSLLPHFAQQHYRPPQIRRSTRDALKAAKNIKDVVKALWDKFANIWTIREDDANFVKNGIINGEDFNIAEGDFNNNPLLYIPIFYVNKLKDLGELLKDFSGALQHLAGVAINYEAINDVKDLVEFMGDYIKNPRERPQAAKKKGVKQMEVVRNSAMTVALLLAKKCGVDPTLSAIIDSAIALHLYGKKYDNEDSKWLKAVRTLTMYTSVKGLALNVKGMIANYTVGELQMIIEAGANEFYNLGDYAWANKLLFGGPKQLGRIMGMVTNDRNSKEFLLSELFDPLNESFGAASQKRYYKNPFEQVLSGDFTFLGYSSGEYLIHYVNMYAMLHNKKVRVDGVRMNLYEAFEVTNKVDGNSELAFKGKDVRDMDGNVIDDKWLANFRKRIRYVNQTTHGSMNQEDKGVFHGSLVGKLVMNFRQWMVEHYSRRFREEHYDYTLGELREGYWRTFLRWQLGWAQDLLKFQSKATLHWGSMTEQQKKNCNRVFMEHILLGALTCLSMALGEPEDHKKEAWYRMFIYQTKRALLDVHASTPTGAVIEAKTMINSPIASINTVNGFLYPFMGWRDMNETLKSGPHKGENKYWRNIKKYTLPFWKDIDQLQNWDVEDGPFQIFLPEKSYR